MKNLLKIISNENYIIVNRDLIKEIGLDETILLSELCSEQSYWESKNKLGKDGFFYSTIDNIENNIGFKKKKQLTLLKKLKSRNLIEVKYHDMPKKRYIKVNVLQLEKIQKKYTIEKEKSDIILNKFDYEIIEKVFFEHEFNKELKTPFVDYILMLKQEKEFSVNLKNVRGIAKSLEKFKELSIEEQKKIIKQSTKKKWKNFYELKENSRKKLEKELSNRYRDSYNNLRY